MTIQGTEGFLKFTAPFNPNVYDIAQVIFRKGNGSLWSSFIPDKICQFKNNLKIHGYVP